MKKSNKSWIYASTVLILALGAGTIVAVTENPAAVSVSADTVAQDSNVVSSAGSAVDAASSALTSAATSAAETGIPVTSSASNVSPSYTSTPSATSSAVSSANSANTSAYSSAASSAASYMSSQASSLSSLASSYSSAVSSYNASLSSYGTVVYSSAGVEIYQGTSGYVVSADNEAALETLLGSNYITEVNVVANASTVSTVSNVTVAGQETATVFYQVTDATQPAVIKISGVGKTNTGDSVDLVLSFTNAHDLSGATLGDGYEIGFQYSDAYNYRTRIVNGGTLTTTYQFVDATTGKPVNGIILFEPTSVWQGEGGSVSPEDDSVLLSFATGKAVPEGGSIPLVYIDTANAYSSDYWGLVIGNSVSSIYSGTNDNALEQRWAQPALVFRPAAPSAKIDYVSVEKPVLYELVTSPRTPSTPATPNTPATPSTPMTPASPKAATQAMPLSTKVSYTLPETGDSAGSSALMYGGFALLGAMTLAGVITRKRRRLIEASEKAAQAAGEGEMKK